jgi:hypothetical protein
VALPSTAFLKSGTMAKKPCRVCRQVLSAMAFKEKHDGTRTLTCVPCLTEQRLYQHAYRHTHKDPIAKSKHKYRAKHKPENPRTNGSIT